MKFIPLEMRRLAIWVVPYQFKRCLGIRGELRVPPDGLFKKPSVYRMSLPRYQAEEPYTRPDAIHEELSSIRVRRARTEGRP